MASDVPAQSNQTNTNMAQSRLHLAYLHAWPLIGKLGADEPFVIKKLDFESERALLFNTLNQANKAIRLQMEVATSDNLLRLITMGCRAIHYTGHGMPTCFPTSDTRVLTDRGFLFLDEIQSIEQQQQTKVRYACYDRTTKQISYRHARGDLIIKQHEGELVNFSQQQPNKSQSDSNNSSEDLFSIRVTPEHQMYVQRQQPGNHLRDLTPIKIAAEDLLPSFETAADSIHMISCVEEGLHSNNEAVQQIQQLLHLTTDEQVDAVLRLLGYWSHEINSGSSNCSHPSSNLSSLHSLSFHARLPSSLAWLQQQLHTAGVDDADVSEEFDTALNRRRLELRNNSQWSDFFNHSQSSSLIHQLSKMQARSFIEGAQLASSDAFTEHTSSTPSSQFILTSHAEYREQLMTLLLHAGYTAHFTSEKYTQSPAIYDQWRITYSDPSAASSASELNCSFPELRLAHDVHREKYSGQVWCVTVDHPDHLIIAQRAQRNEVSGVIERASRPLVIGQCLAFEDEEGKMHPMDPSQLKSLVEAGGPSSGSKSCVEFVFVCACHSESAGLAFVAAGVPHVIAVKTDAAVCDRASQVFMNHFYLALLVGKTVRQSFDIGQIAVRHSSGLSGQDEPRKFLLLPEGANHDKQLFLDIPPGRWTDCSAPPVPHTIPAIPEKFLGRNFLLQKVVSHVNKYRLVTLTGVKGIGKTSVAIASARYIWKRNHFDGVFMIDMKKLLSSGSSSSSSSSSSGNTTGGTAQSPSTTDAHTDSKGNHHSLESDLIRDLCILVSQSCQLPEICRNTSKLFRSLQTFSRLLLILDGIDCVMFNNDAGRHSPLTGEGGGEGIEGIHHHTHSSHSMPSLHAHHLHHHHHGHYNNVAHEIQNFISELLRSVAGSKLLVTSTQAVGGIQEVVEDQIEVKALAPFDAAQLFYDLRPRDLNYSEFGCDDPKRAGSKLGEHPALKLLAGHPRRIFNAVPLLRDHKMAELPPLIEAQIKAENDAANGRASTSGPRATSPSDAASHHAQQQQQQQTPTAALSPPYSAMNGGVPMLANAAAAANAGAAPDMFEHNLYQYFGGHGSARAAALQAVGSPFSEEESSAWTEATSMGVQFWRTAFGRVEYVPWNESVDRVFNHFFMQSIGSTDRPLDTSDLRTMQTKLEGMASQQGYTPGYLHVQVLGQFWRDWLYFCTVLRRILPYWLVQTPCRIIAGWMTRAACTALLQDGFHPQTGQPMNKPVGTFVLRMSESQVGGIAVGFVDQTNKILHTLISMKGDTFLLNLTDGGRQYSTLAELLLQCRPFIYLHPGIDKMLVLAPQSAQQPQQGGQAQDGGASPSSASSGAARGEGEGSPQHHSQAMPIIPPQHPQSQPSVGFQQFPNNAAGGPVGLFSPPTPGLHGSTPLAAQPHSQFFNPVVAAAAGNASPSHVVHAHQIAQHHSFPSLDSVAAALPSILTPPAASPIPIQSSLIGSNPLGEGSVEGVSSPPPPRHHSPASASAEGQQ